MIESFVKQLTEASSPPEVTSAGNNSKASADAKKDEPVLYSTSGAPLRKLAPFTNTIKADKQQTGKPEQFAKEKLTGLKEFLMKRLSKSYPVKVFKSIRDRVSKNPLFSVAPDAATRAVFAQSQLVIWSVEGKFCHGILDSKPQYLVIFRLVIHGLIFDN